MRTTLLLAAALVLAACGKAPAADGYEFEGKEYTRSPVVITVVEYPSVVALRKEAALRGARDGDREIMAFATLDPVLPRCTIHVVDPAVIWAPEWLGHELAHCLHGRWHG